MGLREDMRERLAYVAKDEGLDIDKLIEECVRVALLDTKLQLMAFWPVLQNVVRSMDEEAPDLEVIRKQLHMSDEWIRRWDQRLTAQA